MEQDKISVLFVGGPLDGDVRDFNFPLKPLYRAPRVLGATLDCYPPDPCSLMYPDVTNTYDYRLCKDVAGRIVYEYEGEGEHF